MQWANNHEGLGLNPPKPWWIEFSGHALVGGNKYATELVEMGTTRPDTTDIQKDEEILSALSNGKVKYCLT